jgi:hypothetical protein
MTILVHLQCWHKLWEQLPWTLFIEDLLYCYDGMFHASAGNLFLLLTIKSYHVKCLLFSFEVATLSGHQLLIFIGSLIWPSRNIMLNVFFFFLVWSGDFSWASITQCYIVIRSLLGMRFLQLSNIIGNGQSYSSDRIGGNSSNHVYSIDIYS